MKDQRRSKKHAPEASMLPAPLPPDLQKQPDCDKNCARPHRGGCSRYANHMNINNPFKMGASHTRGSAPPLISTLRFSSSHPDESGFFTAFRKIESQSEKPAREESESAALFVFYTLEKLPLNKGGSFIKQAGSLSYGDLGK